jgi:small-conductance mechanosensitive channel
MNDIFGFMERHDGSLLAMLATVGLVTAAFIISYIVKRPVLDTLRQFAARLGFPYETVVTATRLLMAVLWIIVGLLALEVWGVSVGGIWTLLVSAATIVGVGFLATWTMISNITASFFIAVWRPFHLGDTVEIIPENCSGRVIDNNLMFIVVRESSGTVLNIPNNLLFQKMFRVTGRGSKTLFEEYESRTSSGERARVGGPG